MSLKEVFESYVMFGGTTSVEGGMTSVKFMKVLNDAKLLDKKLDKTSADLIFTKAHTKGKPRLGLEQFAHALEACATGRIFTFSLTSTTRTAYCLSSSRSASATCRTPRAAASCTCSRRAGAGSPTPSPASTTTGCSGCPTTSGWSSLR